MTNKVGGRPRFLSEDYTELLLRQTPATSPPQATCSVGRAIDLAGVGGSSWFPRSCRLRRRRPSPRIMGSRLNRIPAAAIRTREIYE